MRRHTQACSLSRLDTAADLGLETGLDRGNRPARATALAGEEVQTVLLAEESVRRLADLARDVLDWVLVSDRQGV